MPHTLHKCANPPKGVYESLALTHGWEADKDGTDWLPLHVENHEKCPYCEMDLTHVDGVNVKMATAKQSKMLATNLGAA